MKTLVIYYSFEGNTKHIGDILAKTMNADVLELKPEKDIKTHGFMKYFWGGMQVIMKQEPELLTYDNKTNDYDLIIIGTPVWAGTFTPPLRTFFSKEVINDKKIALYCCHDGGMKNVFINMKEKLSNDNTIISELDFMKTDKNRESYKSKAISWGTNLISKID